MVSSSVYPSLERHPGGPDNWVERAKGLPKYIERIAKHLHYEKGMSISRAIAVAVNTVKRWANGGTVTKGGTTKHVSAKTIALATAAVAEWNMKRLAGRIHLSVMERIYLDLSQPSEGLLYDLLELTESQIPSAQSSHRGTMAPDVAIQEGLSNVDLAVPASKLTALKRRGYAKRGVSLPDGSFPIFDATSLKSAIRLARTPQQCAWVTKRAKALGLTSMLPATWSKMDMSSSIPPRGPGGRAKDGRPSFKRQGKWGHGFVPLDQAAKEAKAKGSPIALRRMNRLFGGRVGQRVAGNRKNNETGNITVKEGGTSNTASSAAALGNVSKFTPSNAPIRAVKDTHQLEASKSSRIPKRSSQNWSEIPANLKTVRNGKRYVIANFNGKQVLTPWVGGVNVTENKTPAPLASITPGDAKKLTTADLRSMLKDKRNGPIVRKQLNAELRRRNLLTKKLQGKVPSA